MRWRWLVVPATLFAALPALAQDPCEPPPEGVEQTFPADRAAQVPTDAVVRVRYGASPPRDAESAFRLRERDSRAEVPGTAQRIGRELVFVPDAPMRVNTEHELVAPDPLGEPYRATFTTSSQPEQGPPVFGSIREVTSEEAGLESCGAPDGGYRITSTFDAARDDGPAEDIEYVVYQTRGPGIEEPLERVRVRGLSVDQPFAAFLLPRSDASSPICLAALAYDGRGNVGGDAKEKCIDPVQGNYFASCAAAPGEPGQGSRGAAGLALVLALGAVVLGLVRRRR